MEVLFRSLGKEVISACVHVRDRKLRRRKFLCGKVRRRKFRRKEISPLGNFAVRKFRRKEISLLEISTYGYFAVRKFRRKVSSPYDSLAV